MTRKILIVSDSGDIHVDCLIPILQAKGAHVFRLDLDCFPRDYRITQNYFAGNWRAEITHIPSNSSLASEQIDAVWLRKSAEYSFGSDNWSVQEQAYAKLETDQTFFALLYSLDCYWMSHPLSVRQSMWKGEQLQRAMKLGFRVPATLITNCPEQVKHFKRAINSDIIYKSMSTPTLAAEMVTDQDRVVDGLATTLVDDEMLAEIDSVRELASQFQEYIPKQYELRVTVIGEQLFAAKLHTQDDRRTMIDSRDMSAPIRYEAVELPEPIAQRCRAFVHGYGLQFGAIDLIVTPDNDYVFLENNPVGQFLYIEQLIPELKLMNAMADTLIRGAACQHR